MEPNFICTDVEEWYKFVGANTDSPYMVILRWANYFAVLVEGYLKENNKEFSDLTRKELEDIDYKATKIFEISGAMGNIADKVLGKVWFYGNQYLEKKKQ